VPRFPSTATARTVARRRTRDVTASALDEHAARYAAHSPETRFRLPWGHSDRVEASLLGADLVHGAARMPTATGDPTAELRIPRKAGPTPTATRCACRQ
jgi:hypothetical protein